MLPFVPDTFFSRPTVASKKELRPAASPFLLQTSWQEFYTPQARQRWREITGQAPPTPSTGGWYSANSPFYARNLREAKWRGWSRALQSPENASLTANQVAVLPVGPAAAQDFGVPASMSWRQFAPASEDQVMFAWRREFAESLVTMALYQLSADYAARGGGARS